MGIWVVVVLVGRKVWRRERGVGVCRVWNWVGWPLPSCVANCQDYNEIVWFYNLLLIEQSWFCLTRFHGIVTKLLWWNVETVMMCLACSSSFVHKHRCRNNKNREWILRMFTCSLWLSPIIRGCWFTPKKKTHSRQLAIQIRFAATITWTRSQCSTLTACQQKKRFEDQLQYW
jgi:hypothetical protein